MTKITDGIVFYRSFYEAIKPLQENDKLKIYEAIFEYGLNDSMQELQGVSKSIFTLIKPQLDANKKRRQNGGKGGRPKTKTKPKHNLEITKGEPNKNNKENNNNKLKDKKNKKTDFDFARNDWKPLLKKWLDYRNDLKKKEQWDFQYRQLLKTSNDNLDTAKKIIEQSIGSGWKGLFSLKKDKEEENLDEEWRRRYGI